MKVLTIGAITVRHACLHEYSAGCRALGRGAPFTGTAYYLAPGRAGWDAAWARWQTIIAKVLGFMGSSGGPMVEEVDGYVTRFLVLMGWETVELHDAYHRTEEFARLRDVLTEPTKGYAYYEHVRFYSEGGDEKSLVVGNAAKL